MCTKMCAQLSDYVMYEFYYQTRVIMNTAMWATTSQEADQRKLWCYIHVRIQQ